MNDEQNERTLAFVADLLAISVKHKVHLSSHETISVIDDQSGNDFLSSILADIYWDYDVKVYSCEW